MWQVIGQTRAVAMLQRSLERGALAHAYLFIGPPHTGKMSLAVNLAQALNCTAESRPCGECPSCRRITAGSHADVQIIGLAQGSGGEGKLRAEISIDQVRQVQHFASLPPFEGNHRVYIVESAESLSTEAANCLLKTLEEPVGKVAFVLLTANENLLPATVVSRCQRLELKPVATAEIESALAGRGVEAGRAALLARVCHGGVGWAMAAAADDAMLEQHQAALDNLVDIISGDTESRFAWAAQTATRFSQDREAVYAMLGQWQEFWRDLLLVKIGCPDAVTNIDRLAALTAMAAECSAGQIKRFVDSIRAAGEQLKRNANPRLVLEVLMIDMPEVNHG